MKGLDWTNERWVRTYIRDTPAWLLLGYETQNLYLQLLRKMDRAGVIPLDETAHPHESVAVMFPGAVPDRVERQLEKLTGAGFLLHDRGHACLLDPGFIERDEAAMTDRQRQRESRAKRRDRSTVTKSDEESRNGAVPSQPVTAGHNVSHGVTPIRSDPSLAVPDQEEEEKAARERAGDVEGIFAHYRLLSRPAFEVHTGEKADLDPVRVVSADETKAIAKALDRGHTPEQICKAMDRAWWSPVLAGKLSTGNGPKPALECWLLARGGQNPFDRVVHLLALKEPDEACRPTDPPKKTPPKLSPQQRKVKAAEDWYAERQMKAPNPSALAKWLSALGGDGPRLLLFLDDMEGRGKVETAAYCWQVIQDWSPRRGNGGRPGRPAHNPALGRQPEKEDQQDRELEAAGI